MRLASRVSVVEFNITVAISFGTAAVRGETCHSLSKPTAFKLGGRDGPRFAITLTLSHEC